MYPFMIMSTIFSGIYITIFNKFYNKLMYFDYDNIKKNYMHSDFYIEELLRIAIDS